MEMYISKGWRIFSGNCLATIPNQVIGSVLPYVEVEVDNFQWGATIPNQDIDNVTSLYGGRCVKLIMLIGKEVSLFCFMRIIVKFNGTLDARSRMSAVLHVMAFGRCMLKYLIICFLHD